MAKPIKRKKAVLKAKGKNVPPKANLPEILRRYTEVLDLPRVRKAPRLLSLLFCDFTNTTNDNKTNLLGIFDRVFVHPEKKQSPRFIVYGRVAEALQSPLVLRVFDPDNTPQAELSFEPPAMPTDRDPNLPNQIQFMLSLAMKFEKQGTYWFDISYQDSSLGGAGLVVGHTAGGKDSGTDTFA